MPRHTVRRRLMLAAAATLAFAGAAQALEIEIYRSEDPQLSLGQMEFEGGKTLDLSVGIGSGAFRRADAPADEFVTVSDRGPNFTCGAAEEIIGIKGEVFCGDIKRGRIYPRPDYSPSIYRIRVAEGGFAVSEVIPLRTVSGKPVTGMPNRLTVATTENPVDGSGRRLEQDVNSVDAEGIVELADGTFWIGEENATSIFHVAADGRILRRIVPAGTEHDFEGADYEVEGALPALLAKRQANRGIESMAVSPDERFLYFVVQNPLANPDAEAYGQAVNTRLFKMDREQGRLVGEYVYTLTAMAEFPGEEKKKQSTARISELLALDENRLLILDRTEKTTKIFEIDLSGATDILGTKWDETATSPSLEQVTLEEADIVPVSKRLVLDSSSHPELPTKIEGMAFFGNGDLMLINDDDFGISGQRTAVARVKGLDLGH